MVKQATGAEVTRFPYKGSGAALFIDGDTPGCRKFILEANVEPE